MSLAHESSSFIVNVQQQKSDHVTTANFHHRVRYELQFLLPITTLERNREREMEEWHVLITVKA